MRKITAPEAISLIVKDAPVPVYDVEDDNALN